MDQHTIPLQYSFPESLPAIVAKLANDLLSTCKWVLDLRQPITTTALMVNSVTGKSAMTHMWLADNPLDLVKTALSVSADFVIVAGEMWSCPPVIQAERRETFLRRGPGMRFMKHNEFLTFSIFGEGQRWVSLTPLVGGPEVGALRTFGPIEFLESKVEEPEFLNALRHAREMTSV